jgi:hypothetical protein
MNSAPLASDICVDESKTRLASESFSPAVLTDIYAEQNNIVIWRRELSQLLLDNIDEYLQTNPKLSVIKIIESHSVNQGVSDILQDFPNGELLGENITELTEMFCCLFDLQRVGLRLTVLEHAMCPRFHVDKIPCRLVTTFFGTGTQWLHHQMVNRDKLGTGNQGLTDEQSGLYTDVSCINALHPGDVALLKGESWQGNENAGLVHRSPPSSQTEKRLLLTLDFVS